MSVCSWCLGETGRHWCLVREVQTGNEPAEDHPDMQDSCDCPRGKGRHYK